MTDPKALAEAQTTPETFDFAAAVLDRSYPEIKVPVYLDEKSARELVDIQKERNDLMTRIAASKDPLPVWADQLKALDDKHEALVKALKSQEYTVFIRGIAPEQTIKLEEQSYEKFPKEFIETVSPITGAKAKTERENDERDAEFVTLLRQAHLVSVTSPTGAVDSDFSDIEKVRSLFARLPLLARVKIDEAINASTVAVDFYRDLVDEVF